MKLKSLLTKNNLVYHKIFNLSVIFFSMLILVVLAFSQEQEISKPPKPDFRLYLGGYVFDPVET